MSYETQLQANNLDLQALIEQAQSMPSSSEVLSLAQTYTDENAAPAGFGLGGTGAWLEDFNAMKPTGFYYSGEPTLNRPSNVSAYSNVIYHRRTTNEGIQIIIAVNGDNFMIRRTLDGGTTWVVSYQPLDYVVDTGSSGAWSWRKWNSGLAEAWANITESYMGTLSPYSTLSDVWPNNYVVTISNPFVFTEIPVVNATVRAQNGSGCVNRVMANTQNFVLCFNSNVAELTDYDIFIHMSGKWK